jgi:putative ABC transport system permease protein
LLFRPLPISHPGELYALSRKGITFSYKPVVWDTWEYLAIQQMKAVVKTDATLLAVSSPEPVDITYRSSADQEKAAVQYVSGRFFSALDLHSAVGRLITETNDQRPQGEPYAVISYDYWSRRFERDPRVIGRTFHIGDRIYEIIGVSQEGFTGTETGTVVDVFLPVVMHPDVMNSWFGELAVIKPGVAIEPLRAKMVEVARTFEEERLKSTEIAPQAKHNILNMKLEIASASTGTSGLREEYGRALAILGVLVLLLLLITCANVANLMTARAAARSREMALRVAIGAGRWRLARMVIAENALLAVLASMTGSLFAWRAAPFVLDHINPPNGMTRLVLPMDWRVTIFGFFLTLCVILLFGLLPALRASSVTPALVLKGGDLQQRRRLMHGMIAVQVAFCFLVLLVAGLFVATLRHLSHKSTGFSSERLLVLDITSNPAQSDVHWNQLAGSLASVPGVERLSQSGWSLLTGNGWNETIAVEGAQPSATLAYFLSISPGWLQTMNIPIIMGRDIRLNEHFPEVAIVNETFAKEFLHNEHPVGRYFELPGKNSGDKKRLQVVGVARDAVYRDLHEPVIPVVYVPFATGLLENQTFIVRTSSPDPLEAVSMLQSRVTQAGAGFHISNVSTQESLNQAQTLRERLLATLAFFFGAMSLLLAGIGLYGVLNFSVQQREREIGIRLALGTRSLAIIKPLLAGFALAVAFGTISGLALGIGSTRYIQALLYEVQPTSASLVAAPCLIILLTLGAAALPTMLQASKMNPLKMLRAE